MTGTELFVIKNLCAGYGDVPVLKDVSLTVRRGQIVGLAGESGSGKSTLLYAALGLLGKGGRVTAGEIRCEGRDFRQIQGEELRKFRGTGLSLIAQNPADSFHPLRKIGRELRLFVKAHPELTYPEAEAEMLRLLEIFGLKDGKELLGKYAFELSGGMCQRTAIAMAMVYHPQLLLADEPTSALDVLTQKQVIDELRRVRDEAGTAILMVSHNLSVLSYLSDVLYVLYGGRVLEYGKPEEVIHHAAHPYTQALVRAVPQMAEPAPRGLAAAKCSQGEGGCPYAADCPGKMAACGTTLPPLRELSAGHFVRCLRTE